MVVSDEIHDGGSLHTILRNTRSPSSDSVVSREDSQP